MTTTGCGPHVLGILGGMGPLASAAFVRSLYEAAARRAGPLAEQALPRCLLDSDPAFPDRTEAIRAGRDAEFAERLRPRIRGLLDLGATRVVIGCVTAHHFVGLLPAAERGALISLVDLLVEELAARPDDGERLLLVATSGTREARVLERAPGWAEVADRVVLPGPSVQRELHGLLYRLKREPVTEETAARLRRVAEDAGCTAGLVAGCTELHLLTRWLRDRGEGAGPSVVDPLQTLADELPSLPAV
jgi:aspartate racemase